MWACLFIPMSDLVSCSFSTIPTLLIQKIFPFTCLHTFSTVPCDDFDKVQYSSSNRVKPNNVFVNELFCGC